jgi:hypothetical protein
LKRVCGERDEQGYRVVSILMYFYFLFMEKKQLSGRATGIAVGFSKKG